MTAEHTCGKNTVDSAAPNFGESMDIQKAAHILVVEDSPTQARALAQLLAADGYQVSVATNGRAGLLMAKERLPNLVISDISMPEMNGFEMCGAMKQDGVLQRIPVILLTALRSTHDVIRGLECGADNFIRKPYDASSLLARVRSILLNYISANDDPVQPGLKIDLGGVTHFITAERQQIFDLLISTYQEAVQLTEHLRSKQQRLTRSAQLNEVLYKIAEALNSSISVADVFASTKDGLIRLTNILGARFSLYDEEKLIFSSGDFSDQLEASRLVVAGAQSLLRSSSLSSAPTEHEAYASPTDCLQLTLGERVHCVVYLSASSTEFIGQDKTMLSGVAHHVRVAHERARLYEEMEAKVNQRTAALHAERDLLSAVVNTSGALVCMTDRNGIIQLFNPMCESVTGWAEADAISRPCWEVFGDSTFGDVQQFFGESPTAPLPSSITGEWTSRDGSVHSLVWSTASLLNSDGSVDRTVSTGIDITQLRSAEEKLIYLSNYDVLTGLPNAALLRERVSRLKENVISESEVMGFLLCRPARLDQVRTSLGIEAESSVLKQMGQRLTKWQEHDVTIARVGETTFSVTAVKKNVHQVAAMARHLISVLQEPFIHNEQELHLDPCIGVAVFPDDGRDYDTLFHGAEAAMRGAMEGTAEGYEFYRPELNQGEHERFILETALRHAIERDEFVLHFQPQVSLASGKIIGFEALVRWEHPEMGLIAPGRFIGLAEETGLILPIGEWVLRRACQQNCQWQRDGFPAMPVSVNLSARQFSENIVGTIRSILATTGLEPHLLELELTESASMEDPKKTFEILRQLKDMGVQLAIDDFGTGYSNLSYLKQFPVDKLKLDQSFVRDIVTDPHDLSIARAVIAMGHGLGLTVIAEGVETERHLALLAENGCDEIQGYFFSRPVDALACERLMAEDRRLPPQLLRTHKRQRTLLLVDDEPNILSALQRQLRGTGLRILTASSGAEGLALLEREPVDVIVSDQRMPGMTGVDFLRAVKTSHPETVRIVLSGFTELQSVTDAVNEGAIYKFLTKPWDDKQLRAHIQEAMLHKEMADENRRLDLEVHRANQGLSQANRQLEAVLRQQQEQIAHTGISLDIVREALQHVPLPILGLDEEQVVAFANLAAQDLLRQDGMMLGDSAQLFMPQLLEALELAGEGRACIEQLHGTTFEIVAHGMGKGTKSRGRLIIFKPAAAVNSDREAA